MKYMLTIQDKNGVEMFKQFLSVNKTDLISFAKSHALAGKFFISGFSNKAGGWIETYNNRGQLIATTK